MKKIINIYDADFNIIGEEDKNEAHRKGLWHQVFTCLIIKNDKLIIQLRDKTHITDGGLLDISCSRHLLSTEKLNNGVEAIQDELGLNIPFEDLKYLGYFKWATDKGTKLIIPYLNREFYHIFITKNDTSLNKYKLKKGEVDSVFELSISKGRELFNNQVNKLTINGYTSTEDGNAKKIEKSFTKKDFTKYDEFWLKLFNIVEDYNNNRKYLVI